LLLRRKLESEAYNSDTIAEATVAQPLNQGGYRKRAVFVFGHAFLVLFCTGKKEQVKQESKNFPGVFL
jgi:hypothetical protein